MPRLIALLLVLLAGVGLASLMARQSRQAQDKGPRNTFRPRAAARRSGNNSADSAADHSADEVFMMSRHAAAGLRDPLTGSAIDSMGRVWRCPRCQSLYNDSSVAALDKDNHGACVQCQGRQRNLVSFTDD